MSFVSSARTSCLLLTPPSCQIGAHNEEVAFRALERIPVHGRSGLATAAISMVASERREPYPLRVKLQHTKLLKAAVPTDRTPRDVERSEKRPSRANTWLRCTPRCYRAARQLQVPGSRLGELAESPKLNRRVHKRRDFFGFEKLAGDLTRGQGVASVVGVDLSYSFGDFG